MSEDPISFNTAFFLCFIVVLSVLVVFSGLVWLILYLCACSYDLYERVIETRQPLNDPNRYITLNDINETVHPI
jgi:hypothetical protein